MKRVDLRWLADRWEENQAVLRQSMSDGQADYFGARWISLRSVPISRFNHVACIRIASEERQALLAKLRQHFAGREIPNPALMVTPATEPADLGEWLMRQGWTWESVPVMAWQPGPLPLTPAIKVTEAGPDDLAQVFHLVQRVFFPSASPLYLEIGRRSIWSAEQIGMRHFIGWVDGVAVGASSLFCWKGMAGIYNMCTLPAYRSQGIASALLARLISVAQAAGSEGIALVPTPAGRRLYERFGFREVFRERYYTPSHTL
ncbi:MAG TPA: GNAT family N-acetyltransferase [Symbiobacteriaceae bacterium]|nr:GNAT family N-acetyltransferase [Symbiobacteriaceae bacterium]